MRLLFLGAAHEVTGSCYYLEAAGQKFLVDCGMEQGKNLYENKPIPVPAASLDFVLLTHAHIDHSGMLPALYAQGFRGPVITTEATADLCDIMLRDSAHIQEFEAEWRNRKGQRAGLPAYVPPYTMQDALGLVRHMQGKPYNVSVQLAEGIRARFVDAGHLLGSASIELWITEGEVTKKLVFSGDIGNVHQPLIRDPQYIHEADYVIMESTYGDRSHGAARVDYVAELAKVIQRTFDRGGNVVIPSFAVGRTQEMLYFLRQIKEQHLVTGHGDFPVYVDSPLAIEATTIFQRHPGECYDQEAQALLRQGINPISFTNLQTSLTAAESRNINFVDEPKVILSASGMCDAGRVKHHLKHNLWRRECTVLFVGYQAVGTPGRALVDGATSLKLFGEEIHVNAEIRVLPGVSGHADNEGLMQWARAFTEQPTGAAAAGQAEAAGMAAASPLPRFFVCHGEDQVTDLFAERLQKELGVQAMAPYSGTLVDLATGEVLAAPCGVRIAKAGGETAARRRANAVFDRLVAAGQRLLAVIRHNEGGANKDLARFADQINALCDRWDR